MKNTPITFTYFCCPTCHSEIEATSDLADHEAECPACGAKINVPPAPADRIVRHAADDLDKNHTQALKNRTIRIELEDL